MVSHPSLTRELVLFYECILEQCLENRERAAAYILSRCETMYRAGSHNLSQIFPLIPASWKSAEFISNIITISSASFFLCSVRCRSVRVKWHLRRFEIPPLTPHHYCYVHHSGGAYSKLLQGNPMVQQSYTTYTWRSPSGGRSFGFTARLRRKAIPKIFGGHGRFGRSVVFNRPVLH